MWIVTIHQLPGWIQAFTQKYRKRCGAEQHRVNIGIELVARTMKLCVLNEPDARTQFRETHKNRVVYNTEKNLPKNKKKGYFAIIHESQRLIYLIR